MVCLFSNAYSYILLASALVYFCINERLITPLETSVAFQDTFNIHYLTGNRICTALLGASGKVQELIWRIVRSWS